MNDQHVRITPQSLADTILKVAAEQGVAADAPIQGEGVIRLLAMVGQRAVGDAVQRGVGMAIRLIAERIAGTIEPR